MADQARTRRLIGGTIWNSQFKTIRQALEGIDESSKGILSILKKHNQMPLVSAIAIYASTILSGLSSILLAINDIEKIAADYREDQDALNQFEQQIKDLQTQRELLQADIQRLAAHKAALESNDNSGRGKKRTESEEWRTSALSEADDILKSNC